MKWFLTFVFFLFINSAAWANGGQSDEISPGDALPTFSVLSNTGKAVSPSSLKGKPAMIIFFHTKCFDCRKELPTIQLLYEKYKHEITFLAISRAQSSLEIEDYWKTNGLKIPYSAQEDKSVFRLFAKKTIPRIYICDADGIVQKVFVEKVGKRRLERSLRRLFDFEN